MTRSKRTLALVLGVVMLLSIVGCGGTKKPAALKPTIAPPVIASAGVLRAGVDFSYPPFAGEDKGQKVGIDVDVAAALAERLGLKLEFVDVKPADVPAALESKKIDIALGAMPIADAVLANVTVAGSYITDGAGLFSAVASGSTEPTVTPETLGGKKVGVQKESTSFWVLEGDYGDGFATSFTTLREAFDALEKGEVDVVVGDAIVGSYLARDFKTVHFSGQYGSAGPLGVVVMKDATTLETAVREKLDGLAVEGVLDAIRTKWVGALTVLKSPESTDTSTTP